MSAGMHACMHTLSCHIMYSTVTILTSIAGVYSLTHSCLSTHRTLSSAFRAHHLAKPAGMSKGTAINPHDWTTLAVCLVRHRAQSMNTCAASVMGHLKTTKLCALLVRDVQEGSSG
jgi:hypothetical protein